MWEMLKVSPVRLRGNPCLPKAVAWADQPPTLALLANSFTPGTWTTYDEIIDIGVLATP